MMLWTPDGALRSPGDRVVRTGLLLLERSTPLGIANVTKERRDVIVLTRGSAECGVCIVFAYAALAVNCATIEQCFRSVL